MRSRPLNHRAHHDAACLRRDCAGLKLFVSTIIDDAGAASLILNLALEVYTKDKP